MDGYSSLPTPPALPASRPASLVTYRIFFVIAVAAAAVVVFFFFWGLTDGSVSSFNAGLWALLLAGAIGVPVGGYILNANAHRALAIALLALMAVPGLIAGLLILALIVLQPRWN